MLRKSHPHVCFASMNLLVCFKSWVATEGSPAGDTVSGAFLLRVSGGGVKARAVLEGSASSINLQGFSPVRRCYFFPVAQLQFVKQNLVLLYVCQLILPLYLQNMSPSNGLVFSSFSAGPGSLHVVWLRDAVSEQGGRSTPT